MIYGVFQISYTAYFKHHIAATHRHVVALSALRVSRNGNTAYVKSYTAYFKYHIQFMHTIYGEFFAGDTRQRDDRNSSTAYFKSDTQRISNAIHGVFFACIARLRVGRN